MPLNLKQIIRHLSNLSWAEKLVTGGSLLLILGLFSPWISVNEVFTDTYFFVAFTGTTYIVGYLCYFLAIFSLNSIEKTLAVLVAAISCVFFVLYALVVKGEGGFSWFAVFLFVTLNIIFVLLVNNLKILRQLKKHIINLFSGIENVVFVFVAFMIYQKLFSNYTNAHISFGLYLSLAGGAIIFYGGYLQLQTNKKTFAKEVFSQPSPSSHQKINLKPDLNIDKTPSEQNNIKDDKTSQLSFGDYE